MRVHAVVACLVDNDITRGVHLADAPPVVEWAGVESLVASEVHALECLRANVCEVSGLRLCTMHMLWATLRCDKKGRIKDCARSIARPILRIPARSRTFA